MARYLISEAARLTGVEAHVLRFWEEELELEIPRNEQGHRYYTEENIDIFHRIKVMKEAGLPLKTIREKLADPDGEWETNPVTDQESGSGRQEGTGIQDGTMPASAPSGRKEVMSPGHNAAGAIQAADKMMEFESIVYDIVTEALRNNNEKLGKAVSERVNDKVVKELNYLMRENEENMEAHFRKLDEALVQRGRGKKAQKKERVSQGQKEAAVSRVGQVQFVSQSKKRRRLFGKKRKTAAYEIR